MKCFKWRLDWCNLLILLREWEKAGKWLYSTLKNQFKSWFNRCNLLTQLWVWEENDIWLSMIFFLIDLNDQCVEETGKKYANLNSFCCNCMVSESCTQYKDKKKCFRDHKYYNRLQIILKISVKVRFLIVNNITLHQTFAKVNGFELFAKNTVIPTFIKFCIVDSKGKIFESNNIKNSKKKKRAIPPTWVKSFSPKLYCRLILS